MPNRILVSNSNNRSLPDMVAQLHSHWKSLCGKRMMPQEDDLDTHLIEDWMPHCFMRQVRDVTVNSYIYTHLGDSIRKLHKENPDMRFIDAVHMDGKKLASHYAQIIKSCAPIFEEGSFIGSKGRSVHYSQCLLPFGKRNTVETILGCLQISYAQ